MLKRSFKFTLWDDKKACKSTSYGVEVFKYAE